MDAHDYLEHGLGAFHAALDRVEGFRRRDGQLQMATACAHAFAHGELGDVEEGRSPVRAIAVVQAGTGVGKSAAYLLPGLAIAKKRGVKLVVSTSSVLLQDQVLQKDLPMLAATLDEPITFALAKGRGRYVCKQKLHRRALIDTSAQDTLALEEGDGDGETPQETSAHGVGNEAQVRVFRRLADALAAGWKGDRDSLDDPLPPALWSSVAADRHTCAVRACPHFSSCAYYLARRELAGVDVIVANHHLVLASIGTQTLPELRNSLIVFDEAHHLGETAVAQFAAKMDLTRVRWLDKLPRTIAAIADELQVPVDKQVAQAARELKTSLADVGHLLWDNLSSRMRESDGTLRLRDEQIDALLLEPLKLIHSRAEQLDEAARGLVQELRTRMKEERGNPRWSALFSAIGSYGPRLGSIRSAASMLLTFGAGSRTLAKWCEVDLSRSSLAIELHACPVLPGELLREHLWPQIRSAVLTSATIAACGDFEFFMHETGLDHEEPAVVSAEAVASPFRYGEQGRLVVRQTRSAPRNLAAYNLEVAELMAQEVRNVRRGGMALFTSRKHMDQALRALPEDLQDSVLVQGTMPRRELIAEHCRRVHAGQRSVLFGLQGLGEGTDLPGALCERVLIGKLPFSTPSDPVSEARSEYVEACGGSAFDELVVPAAGIRMLQWSGRAIRTEEDVAEIVCFDRRLTERDYGRRILRGLPPYPVTIVPPAAKQEAVLSM